MLIMCSYINRTFLLTPQHQGGQEKNICSQHVTNAEILQIKAGLLLHPTFALPSVVPLCF